MAVKIAFLGLRQIGLSAAYALSKADERIICHGWDADRDTWPSAERQGCLTTIHKKIARAVSGSRVVIMALPPDILEDYADEIKKSVNEECVLMNFSRVHTKPAEWFKAGRKPGVHYLSLFAALSPLFAVSDEIHDGEVSDDLFKNGVISILDPLQADQVALDLAVDVCVLLGGKPLLVDAMEMDGLISANHLLQLVSAAAVMDTTAGQPSWREGKRIAGKNLANVTMPLASAVENDDIASSLFYQKEILVHSVNSLIRELLKYREVLEREDAVALSAKMQEAYQKRVDWLADRSETLSGAELATSIPDEKHALKRLMRLDS